MSMLLTNISLSNTATPAEICRSRIDDPHATHPSVSEYAEMDATKKAFDRVEERFDLKSARLVGGINYGSLALLGWLLEEKQIEPHLPVRDKTERAALSRNDFGWDEQADSYRCPEGDALGSNWRPFKNPRNQIAEFDTIIYLSSRLYCAACPHKKCRCPKTFSKFTCNAYENARYVVRQIYLTPEYQESR